MVRKLKPHVVETICDHKTSTSVDICLDREEKDFFAKVGLETIRADTHAECKKLAWEELKRQRSFEWKKMIDVSIESRDRFMHGVRNDEQYASLRLAFRRFEVTTKADGTQLERPFKTALEEKRLAAKPVADRRLGTDWNAYDRQHGEDLKVHHAGKVEIPYTPEAWATLCRLKQTIEDVRKRLRDLLSKDKAETSLLKATSLPLLPAGDMQRIAAPEAPKRKKCREGGDCAFELDVEYDPINPPMTCTKCGGWAPGQERADADEDDEDDDD